MYDIIPYQINLVYTTMISQGIEGNYDVILNGNEGLSHDIMLGPIK